MTGTTEGDPSDVGDSAAEAALSPSPAFRVLGFFLPDTSLLKQIRFQIVVGSRFLSEIGQEGVFYGSLVAVASGGTVFQASVVGAAKVLPGATLGLLGGAVADALPRRVALGLGYAGQAALCVVIPLFFRSDFLPLLLLVIGVSTLNQLIGPSEKAVIPLVASHQQISSAAATLSLADSIATGLGTAAVAPIVLKVAGERALFYLCAGFLALAAIRVFSLPVRRSVSVSSALQALHLSELDLGFRTALRWLLGWPAIITMVMVGLVVSVLNTVTETLGPSYVGEVLKSDPANTVYVFAPAGLGALVALAVVPKLIDLVGERLSAAIAVLVMTLALFTMAFIDEIAFLLGSISPMKVVRLIGASPSDELLAASFVSLFTGFAVSVSSVSVQTYVNRRVPAIHQGRVFGLRSVLAGAATLAPVLLLGYVAELTSIEVILFFTPWVVLAGIYALLVYVYRVTDQVRPTGGEVLHSFWEEPDESPKKEAT